MVDFRKLISPRSQIASARTTATLEAFSALPKPAQARKFLEVTRMAFDMGEYPEDDRRSYDEWALLRVLPEIARRLDPTVELLSREIPREGEAEKDPVTDVRGADQKKLNAFVGNILAHGSFDKVRTASRVPTNSRDPQPDSPEVVEIWNLLAGRRHDGIIVRAMHSLSADDWPLRVSKDDREPLTGL